MCGEASATCPRIRLHPGPSPRVRGSHGWSVRLRLYDGSIPACAGKPGARGATPARWRVHPRVCGEAAFAAFSAKGVRGPSPRVRGSPRPGAAGVLKDGSIPACAGKPTPMASRSRAGRVHPRVCGEARVLDPVLVDEGGPSPRVRGSLLRPPHIRPPSGSIPACAGKPLASGSAVLANAVHPRVCGEAVWRRDGAVVSEGPSPRVRGSQTCRSPPRRARGSIPACAGEACRIWKTGYPPRGPSPRVRGSRRMDSAGAADRGSIPACAGKPASSASRAALCGVHPRVCGEATPPESSAMSIQGPSPRVRGSPLRAPRHPPKGGSIPACAGKPRWRHGPRRACWVHPRVCGEAVMGSGAMYACWGPSPRVRGSRADRGRDADRCGSIPACAGSHPERRDQRPVYGSIPACAGSLSMGHE